MFSVAQESQSAENLMDYYPLGILREYTPEIVSLHACNNLYLNVHQKNNKSMTRPTSLFMSYLSGLIEGDGTIIVPKTERSSKGKVNYPSIQIVFHLKDLPLALLIQKNLGTGSIMRIKGSNAYNFFINDKKGVLNLINILNGRMKTPKIKSLWLLIDWFNNKGMNINKLPLNNDPIYSDAWLSGMIESDGHFSVRTTMSNTPASRSLIPACSKTVANQEKGASDKGKYPKIECKFELSQRQKDNWGNSNELFLTNIAKFLEVPLKNFRENTPHPQYRLRTSSLDSNLKLVNYLNEYPLFGSKYLDYSDWKEILNLFNPRFKYTEANIDKVLKLKKGINDNRTRYVWDHLNKFYNLDD